MAYFALSWEAAKSAYDQLAESLDVDWDQLEKRKGSGALMSTAGLEAELDELCNQFPLPLSDGAAAVFEGKVGILLHEAFGDPEALVDADFWRWVAFRPVLATLLHRHQTHMRHMPSAANFGLGAPIESFPYRAWTRAAIAFNPQESVSNRYSLALRGDQDFWRSHMLRQRYTYSRELAHALIRFQYPEADRGPTLATGAHPNGIRMLAKRLKRFQANCVLTLLTEEQCLTLLDLLSEGLTRSDGSTHQSTGVH